MLARAKDVKAFLFEGRGGVICISTRQGRPSFFIWRWGKNKEIGILKLFILMSAGSRQYYDAIQNVYGLWGEGGGGTVKVNG